ncbi:MAG TPA: DUF1254 domain-containing protein [Caulobacteraceae bacterium]|nr:DUF1254 domain-containing protein [Caulobacteraceae bacterium]
MHRRAFLASSVALASQAGRVRAETDDLRAAAREGWLYSLPLIETARRRADAGAAGIDAFVPGRRAEPGPGEVSAPEPDLLTASAWLNVGAGGAARLRVPDTTGRYASVTLMDMYGNVLGVFGSGARGDGGGDFTILGPPARVGVAGYTVPEPRMPTLRRVVKARTPWVWALVRVQASGEGGAEAARGLRDAFQVEVKAEGARAPAPSVAPNAGWGDYFFAAQKLIEENPPPAYEADFFRRIAPLQLGAAGGFEKARFADADLDQIQAGVGEARILAADLQAGDGVEAGWSWPKAGVGDYGQDFLLRARTAFSALGAPTTDQLLTLRAAPPEGGLAFAAGPHYRLTLPGPPPVDGLWTLALYEVAPDGRLFPTANPIDRYALGSGASSLRRRPAGEIDVWIGPDDPGGAHTSNWLPSPTVGRFALTLRAYLPKPELLARQYRPPPVELLARAPPPSRR